MRFMLVESRREIESEVKALEKRLEARTRPIADKEGRLCCSNSSAAEAPGLQQKKPAGY